VSLPASLRHLREYVAIPSVNPMGRDDLPAGITGETRLAEHVREQLRRLGVDAELVGRAERRSVVAELRAEGDAETLLVASHLDTVPVDGMEIPPFDPVVREGRLYGRGSCDTKAGLAALMEAVTRVLARGRLRRNLVLVGEADEEYTSVGVADVLAHLGPRRPSWVLATEPTGLRVVTRHKGVAFARFEARGRACHASQPEAGRNAVVALARVAVALDELAERLRTVEDPRLGSASLSIGQIAGGRAPNIVPDHAWLVADRRLLPGEDEASMRAEFQALLADCGVEGVELRDCRVEKPPLGTPEAHPAVEACRSVLRQQGLPDAPAAVAFGTDAGLFEQAGLPGVVMGPGSIARAHTAREYVEIDQVEAMTEIFVRLLTG